MTKLTAKQDLFCREFIIDLNATQAAVRAGYSERTARITASRLLSNVNIASRINELKEKREKKVGIDAQWVLERAVELHNICVKEKEYNAANKSLEIVGKHISVNAFDNKVTLAGDPNKPLITRVERVIVDPKNSDS